MIGRKLYHTFIALAMMGLLSACASGTKLSLLGQEAWQVLSGKGQIVVYRTQILGAAFQPTIRIDGRETGDCTAKGVFVIDVAPGDYDISAKTETESRIRVSVSENERVYIRCEIGVGLIAGRPKLKNVPAIEGDAEIGGLSFTGRF